MLPHFLYHTYFGRGLQLGLQESGHDYSILSNISLEDITHVRCNPSCLWPLSTMRTTDKSWPTVENIHPSD